MGRMYADIDPIFLIEVVVSSQRKESTHDKREIATSNSMIQKANEAAATTMIRNEEQDSSRIIFNKEKMSRGV